MTRHEEKQRKGGKEGKEEKGRKQERERRPVRRPPQDDAELDSFIRALVDSFPPLTEEQETLLALLFSGIVDG